MFISPRLLSQPRKKACVVKDDSSYTHDHQKHCDGHKVLKPLVFMVPHIASIFGRRQTYSAIQEGASRAGADPRRRPKNLAGTGQISPAEFCREFGFALRSVQRLFLFYLNKFDFVRIHTISPMATKIMTKRTTTSMKSMGQFFLEGEVDIRCYLPIQGHPP